jgi:hypothetical protein
MVAVGSSLISGVFCNSEIMAEIIPLGGVTSFQEPGWELGMNGVGRGKWLVKWARNWSSIPLGKPSSKDLNGMLPMRFSLPGQWVQSAGVWAALGPGHLPVVGVLGVGDFRGKIEDDAAMAVVLGTTATREILRSEGGVDSPQRGQRW